MRMATFALRNAREVLRDPLTLFFGIFFPVILLLLLSAIQANIPVDLFTIERLAPGICVFGMSFISLFTALIISKDRSSAFLERLYTTPLTPVDFILGYSLPMIPVAILQNFACYGVAIILGLKASVNIIIAMLFNIPVAVMFISIGLMFGSILTDKQVGGICGALMTNLSAWLSGIWFDLKLVGGTFEAIAYSLPFVHAVDMTRLALSGSLEGIVSHFLFVLCYTFAFALLAVVLFFRQMKK